MTREEAIRAIDHLMYSSPHESADEIVTKKYYSEKLIDYIANTVDIVRCKECRWRGEYFFCPIQYRTDDDFFCKCGERR